MLKKINKQKQDLTICVICTGMKEYSKMCIESLIQNTSRPKRIIVVNSIEDGLGKWAKKQTGIDLYKFSNFTGKTQALNYAVKWSSEFEDKYFLAVDNDTYFPVGWDRYVFDFLDSTEKFGAAFPITIDTSLPFEFPGMDDSKKKRIIKLRQKRNQLTSSELKKIMNDLYADYGGFDKYAASTIEKTGTLSPIKYGSGIGAILVKRSILDKIGGWDEAFIGPGWLDIDFYYSMKQLGYLALSHYQWIVHHWMSITKIYFSENLAEKEARNKKYFSLKWGQFFEEDQARENLRRAKKLEIGPGEKRIDPTWKTLGLAKGPEIDIVFDISNQPLPIEENAFDLIYMSHVLEHIPWWRTDQVLSEIYRILSSGGIVEIWVPDFEKFVDAYLNDRNLMYRDNWFPMNEEHSFMKWLNGRIFNREQTYEMRHKALFDAEYLEERMRKAGFIGIHKIKKPRGYDHGWINLGLRGCKP